MLLQKLFQRWPTAVLLEFAKIITPLSILFLKSFCTLSSSIQAAVYLANEISKVYLHQYTCDSYDAFDYDLTQLILLQDNQSTWCI